MGRNPLITSVSALTLRRVCSFGNSLRNSHTSPLAEVETRLRPAFSRSTSSMKTLARP